MPAAAPPSFQTSPFYPSLHSPPSFSFLTSPRRSHFRTITSSRKLSISPGHLSSSSRSSFYHSFKVPEGLEEEEHVIGDSVVFEEGVFEDPYLQDDFSSKGKEGKHKGWKNESEIQNNLVPENWRQIQEEINITKKERQRIAHELKFGPRWEKKRILATRDVNLPERLAYREEKLAKWKPLVLDNPTFQAKEEKAEATDGEKYVPEREERVAPKNPRWDVYGRTLDNISELFNSVNYKPGHNASKEGQRRLFTMEEKALLNRRIPDLAAATSEKWLPLQALAASGEFYLMHALLKHNVDINGADKDGLTALHKAIIGKRQAITCYLLRESANPFVRDKDGTSLMHYAVQAASVPAIKILLLYNVDINLQDKDGWTPLHVAVQTRRTDLVRLLLIKGADQSIKNQDGLTPLDLCLHSGRDTRTYELIKLLKQLPEFRLTANTGRALPLQA